MTLIICLDDNNGMLFNKRRQSMDSAVRDRILEQCQEHILCMNHYSANQFLQQENINICESMASIKNMNCWYFLENEDPSGYMMYVDRVYVYRWNREYPTDVYFPFNELIGDRMPESVFHFPGNSHTLITEEVYYL